MFQDGPSRGDIILIDTNVIIHSVYLKTWKAIASTFELHTVEQVIQEALKKPRDKPPISISEKDLRASFKVIYKVSDEQSAEWIIEYPELMDLAIDGGEAALLSYFHACGDKKVWFLCGPDVGSMKGLNTMGALGQLVSLERLHQCCGLQKKAIENQYTQKWHENTVYDIKSNLR
tara:strand:+ start:5449 stop:5973 length:525 start_codon:yes stop_codon:yes gene_type:complete